MTDGEHHDSQPDDDVKTRLRVRAADNGRSMEEVRRILRDVVGRKPSARHLTKSGTLRINSETTFVSSSTALAAGSLVGRRLAPGLARGQLQIHALGRVRSASR